MEVTTLSETKISDTVIKREIKIDVPKQKLSHTLTQLHYIGWPDWGLPQESEGVMHIVSEMVKLREASDKPNWITIAKATLSSWKKTFTRLHITG